MSTEPVTNKVTLENIISKIKKEEYVVLPSGKVMVCELTLENGFTVRGQAAVVDKANFNEDIGKQISKESAIREIWQLEGYLLQEQLYKKGSK